MDPESTNNQAREEAGPKRSPRNPVAGNPLGNSGGSTVVALFRVGTRGCLLAAALMVVVTVLVTQTATQAIAEARQTVLYLDAPAVSTDRATRAGETAKAYSDPRSPALPDALAWLGVGPAARAETGPPPQGASAAFASITAPDAEGTPGLTAEAAYDAGETMLAQIEDGAPPSSGGASESDLAAAGDAVGVAVRPELGDGSPVPERGPEEEPSADYEAPPAEQPTTPDLASSPEPVEHPSGPAGEPTGDEGLTLEAPAPTRTELAEVDSTSLGDASPAPRPSLDARPDYGATGPISEPAADPSTAPRDESADGPAANPEDGGGELAGVQTEPAANPEPAQGTTREEPAYGGPVSGAEPADDTAPEDPVATPDTGPTGSRGDAVVPAPSTPPADDGASQPATPEDPASTRASGNPAPENSAPKGSALEGSAPAGAGQGDGSGEEIPGDQGAEIVVLQASEAGGGADGPASASQRVPPSDDRASEPEVTPPPEPTPEELPAGANTTPDGTSPEGLPAPDSSLQEGTDAASGSGEDSAAASPSLVGEPGGEPTEPTDDQSGEQPAGSHQDDPTETTTAEGSPPTPASPPDEGTTGQEPTPTDETGGDHASQEAFQDGDQVGPEDSTEQAPALADDSSLRPMAEPDADDEAPEDDSPQGGSRSDDHAGALPDAGLERAGEGDGGAESEQEVDQRSTGHSDDEQQSATEIQREESSGDGTGRAGFDGTGRGGQTPAAPEGRSGDDEGASREDAEAKSSEGSRTASYLIRPVDPADRDLAGSDGDRVGPAGTEEAARAVPSSGGPSGLSQERRTDGEPPQGALRQPDTGPVASKPAPESTPGRPSTAPKERPVNGNGGAWRTPPAWAPAWGRGGVPHGRPNGQRAASEETAGDRRAAVRANRLARRQAAERADHRVVASQAARERARRERFARRRRVAAEKVAAARRADRVAERHADRRAGRIAAGQAARQVARERAAADRAAIHAQRRRNRLATLGAFGGQSQAAPAADRQVPSYKGSVAEPSAAEQVPVPPVGTQRTGPVERPPAVQPPPARQVPASRLDPAPRVQPQVQTQPRQQSASDGGAGPVGGGVQMPRTVDPNPGW